MAIANSTHSKALPASVWLVPFGLVAGLAVADFPSECSESWPAVCSLSWLYLLVRLTGVYTIIVHLSAASSIRSGFMIERSLS